MLIMGCFNGAGGVDAVINTAGDLDVLRSGSGGTVYAGLQLRDDGTSDGNNADGSASFSSPTAEDNWLSSGSPTGVFVERTIVSGSADWLDDYAGSRVAITTQPRIGCQRTTAFGADNLIVTLDFYDAASGGTLLGSIANIQIQASRST